MRGWIKSTIRRWLGAFNIHFDFEIEPTMYDRTCLLAASFGLTLLVCPVLARAAEARAPIDAGVPSGEAVTLNTLSNEEAAAGWILLFDGKSTRGWRNYRKDGVSNSWQVADGVLTCRKGAGDLITQNAYDAFELVLDYKVDRGANSGVMFHVAETGEKPWHTGPEVQILDNAAYDGKDETQMAGWLYDLYPGKEDATRPTGQWNRLRLLVTPNKGRVELNGKEYLEFNPGSDDWNRRVAASKFKNYPEFGKLGRGHICLQDHGGGVAFRNIKLRPIAP